MKRKKISKTCFLYVNYSVGIANGCCAGLVWREYGSRSSGSEKAYGYKDEFNYQANIDSLLGTDEWDVETYTDTATYVGTEPKLVNGAIRMEKKNSVRFNWTQLDGIGDYDASKTYTFEFDVKIIDFGGDDPQRDLYAAPGGWYNQVQLNAKVKTMVVGTTNYSYNEADYEGQELHVKLDWTGDTIRTTITGDPLDQPATGSRTSSSYTDLAAASEAMTFFVMRCESGVIEIDNFSFTDGTTTYKQDFEKLHFLSTDQWDVETYDFNGEVPKISNGVVKMKSDESIRFNWTKVAGVGAYDASKTYTFEFDAKVTDWNFRSLFVAPGGWYNQVELPSATEEGKIRAGDTYKTYDVAELENKKLHVKLEWTGQTITSTITNEAGTVLATGSRTSSAYADMEMRNGAMTYMAIRCTLGAVEIDNFSFTDGTTTYTENFDLCGLDPMLAMLEQDSNVWDIGGGKIDSKAPIISNGVVKMHNRSSLQFLWKNVPGIGEYDSAATYTFEFDAIARNLGDGSAWNDSSGVHTRVLYVANNAYYTQIEFFNKDGQIKVANSKAVAWSNRGALVHMKVEWTGNTVISTVTDAAGNVLVTGSRTVTVDSNMNDITLRCEDGAIDIDNFKFTKIKSETTEQDISIPEGKQAVYECNVEYVEGTAVKYDLGGKTSDGSDASGELFKISDDGMAIGGFACAGTYGKGTYGVKMYLNPTQHAALVEVTLPNGGVVRRGSHSLLYDCTSITKLVTMLQNASEAITDEKVTYVDIDYKEDVLNTTEPVYEGFEANVYNLVTAFDVDAKTTRTFAWTALESFVGDAAMSVQYRVKGASEWQTVDAVKEVEDVEYDTEDYFKADITGLTAGTTYEYRIGTASEWGKTYTFTTEAENVNNFSFVAIGDTQGSNWNGTTGGADTRGFMYAQAALKQAIAETGNPAFILHTGDITEHGTKQSHWNGYFKALGDFGKTIPHFAAIGNHDVWSTSSDATSGSADNFDLHFNHPNNGGSKAFAEGTVEVVTAKGNQAATSLVNNLDETTYSFNYGNTHFVVLNTGEYDSAAGPIDKIIIEAQTEWLINDLEANKDAEWTILMMHEPLYHRLEAYGRLEGIHEVIEEYGVDLAILGHSHLVTRTYPMKNGQIVSKTITDEIEAGTGTVYSTIGATTPSHDPYGAGIIESMHTTFTPAKGQPTYTTVSVNAGEIRMTIKQIDGLVVDEFVIFKEAKEFTGVTLVLGGKIGVNFYVPKNHGFSDEAYVEFESEDSEKHTVSIKDSVETKHGRKFTYWVPAKEMADTITATIYDGGEVKDVISTSIREYAEILISGSETNAEYKKAKELINAMLNYGAYAQKLFDYNTGDLANKNDMVVNTVESVNASELAGFAKERQGLEDFGYLAGSSLVLKGETKLKMFFEFAEGASLEGLTFTIDGAVREYTRSGNYYVVEIENISARLLDKDYKVTAAAGNQTFDAVTSAMTFCYNALTNTDDTDLHKVAKALYLYNKEADAYSNASN